MPCAVILSSERGPQANGGCTQTSVLRVGIVLDDALYRPGTPLGSCIRRPSPPSQCLTAGDSSPPATPANEVDRVWWDVRVGVCATAAHRAFSCAGLLRLPTVALCCAGHGVWVWSCLPRHALRCSVAGHAQLLMTPPTLVPFGARPVSRAGKRLAAGAPPPFGQWCLGSGDITTHRLLCTTTTATGRVHPPSVTAVAMPHCGGQLASGDTGQRG